MSLVTLSAEDRRALISTLRIRIMELEGRALYLLPIESASGEEDLAEAKKLRRLANLLEGARVTVEGPPTASHAS